MLRLQPPYVLPPLLALGCSLGPAGVDTMDRQYAAAHAVFRAHGLCADSQDCTRRQLMLWDGGHGRTLYLNVYGVTEPAVVAELVDSCARITAGTPKSADVVMSFLPDPKRYPSQPPRPSSART